MGLPVAVVQQLYVNVEINCQQMKELCDKPYHSTSKLVAAHMLSKMEHSIRYVQSLAQHQVYSGTSEQRTLWDLPQCPL